MTGMPELGATAAIEVAVTEDLLERFALYCGDRNPMHFDDAYAQTRGLNGRVAHGMAYASHISTLIGMHLPGAGALWAHQTIRFLKPARIGDLVTLSARVRRVSERSREVDLEIEARNQRGDIILSGEAGTMLPVAGSDRPEAERSPLAASTGRRGAALVFGASGALGGAIARRLSADGFAIGLCGRTAAALDQTADGLDGPAVALACDLTEPAQVAQAIEQALQTIGPIRAVVHCASAPLAAQPVLELDWDMVDAHLAVQARGLVHIMRSCSGPLRDAGGGTITYIGSTATHGAPPAGLSAYAAAKATGCSLIRSMAAELAPSGIRANIVSPNFLETDLTTHVPERARKLAAAQTPLRRLAELDEVATAVAFVAGTGGSFVNGHDLVVDGGKVMA